MKTSFYFVVWIIIYPILELLNVDFINRNSFVVALVIVWGLSWVLNRVMPETFRDYERAIQIAPILEDVYLGNVTSFRKRLSRLALLEIIYAIYFCVTIVVIALTIFMAGVNDWIALVIFAFFAMGAISGSIKLSKALSSIKANPTPEHSMEIAEEYFNLDYASYYEERQSVAYGNILPARPRYFKAFLWISIIFASIAFLLGVIYVFLSVAIMLTNNHIEAQAWACMIFLYGSLAAYFGVKDFMVILQSFRGKLRSKVDRSATKELEE